MAVRVPAGFVLVHEQEVRLLARQERRDAESE